MIYLKADIPKLVTIIDGISVPANVATLVNEIAYKESNVNGNVNGGAGEDVAGQKMVSMISGTLFAETLVFILDNPQPLDTALILLSDGNDPRSYPVFPHSPPHTPHGGQPPTDCAACREKTAARRCNSARGRQGRWGRPRRPRANSSPVTPRPVHLHADAALSDCRRVDCARRRRVVRPSNRVEARLGFDSDAASELGIGPETTET